MTARRPPWRRMVALIAQREIITRLRAKSLYVVTGLLVVAVIGIGVIARISAGDDTEDWTIGLAGLDDDGFADAVAGLGASIDVDVTTTDFEDAETARQALERGDIDTVVEADRGRLLFDDDVNERVAGVVQQAWATSETRRGLVDAGLQPDEVDAAFAVRPLQVDSVGDDDVSDVALATGTLAGILLFISLQTFGTYVLTGVVEEKSSAVVEVLLVRTRPSQLLAGKVIGIGLVALGQFLVAIAAAVVALAISGTDVPAAVWSAVPTTAVWFLGGYTMYSTLFALAGSLVSRQEDAQAAAVPVSTLLIASYMLIFILGFEPESTASTVLSMVPFVAPLLMPLRMAAGAASSVEVVVAFALVALTTWLIWVVASRIYGQVLLRRGTRISWRAAVQILRTTA